MKGLQTRPDYCFVLGCDRSGTTALTRLLHSHPNVVLGMERYKQRLGIRDLPTFGPPLFEPERFMDFQPGDTNITIDTRVSEAITSWPQHDFARAKSATSATRSSRNRRSPSPSRRSSPPRKSSLSTATCCAWPAPSWCALATPTMRTGPKTGHTRPPWRAGTRRSPPSTRSSRAGRGRRLLGAVREPVQRRPTHV